jgi:hypothetical protein
MNAGNATLPPRLAGLCKSLYFRHCVDSELLPNSVPTFDTYRSVKTPAIMECMPHSGFAYDESAF